MLKLFGMNRPRRATVALARAAAYNGGVSSCGCVSVTAFLIESLICTVLRRSLFGGGSR